MSLRGQCSSARSNLLITSISFCEEIAHLHLAQVQVSSDYVLLAMTLVFFNFFVSLCLCGQLYAKLHTWKSFPPQSTPPRPTSNKTPNITKDLLPNSRSAWRASVKAAAKNIASDRKSRANSLFVNASTVCSTLARRSSNSPLSQQTIFMMMKLQRQASSLASDASRIAK